MEAEEAIAMVKHLQLTVAGDIEGLIKGQKAANQRLGYCCCLSSY